MAPLLGGLTNLSYLVEDAGEKFVVRCGDDIPVHHVFRDRERAASVAAHAAGLSPEVVARLQASLVKALADEKVISRFADLGTKPVPADESTPAALG